MRRGVVFMRTFGKSSKLDNVLYDVRGPVVDEAARMEEDGMEILKLNIGNPYPFGFSAPQEVILDMLSNVRTSQGYSDSKGIFSARKAIMQYAQLRGIPGVTINDIYTGNGVSELINLCMQALLDNGDEILIPAPDYPLWTATATLAGGNVVHYVCDEQSDWYPDIDDIRSKITDKTKAIVIINPNNPTGITIPQDLLEEILETCAMQGIFMVVDECFLDFVKDPEKYTLKGKLEKYPGLFILKAFTKRYAIPGVRLGYGFCSDRKVLDRMEAVTQPWNVSTMAQQAGMAALKESEYVEAGRQIIFRESAWMKEKMRQVGLTVYPSEANYIFFYGPEDLFERCVAKGILIRDCSNYLGLKKGYYRVAVKLHEQNEKLIEVLEEVLS